MESLLAPPVTAAFALARAVLRLRLSYDHENRFKSYGYLLETLSMSTLERAIALAATVHAGQRDKAGAPYILHPLRMMLKMKSVEAQMAAVLHDVVEDCGVTSALLVYEGFPTAVVEAVGALTKRIVNGAEEPYDEFIQRAAQNPIARMVKLADLEDNMDLSRIAQPTQKDFERIEKYKAAKLVIERSIAEAN